MNLEPTKHSKDSLTHYACKEQILKDGGCCACSGHECQKWEQIDNEFNMMSNHELFSLYNSAIRQYESAFVRHLQIDLDSIMLRTERLKSEILSRMHSPEIIKLNVK